MTSLVLLDLILKSLTLSVNAPLESVHIQIGHNIFISRKTAYTIEVVKLS
jgi:hypothetical protein